MKRVNPKGQNKARFDTPLKPINLTYKQCVNQANDVIESFLPVLTEHSVMFDSRLRNRDLETCVNSLVCSRILKKFVPKTEHNVDLKTTAIMAFLEYEKDLKVRTKSFSLADAPELWTLRRRVRDLLKPYKVEYSDSDFDVGPGETFITSRGYTSLLAKMSDRNHWTTTEECLDDTRLLCFQNRAFRRAALLHIGHISDVRRETLRVKYKGHPLPRFAIFCELLDDILIVVGGSRASTVPKNNETDRFINIEPFFPMVLQRYVAAALKRCLKKAGYALDGSMKKFKHGHESDRQKIHGEMIRYVKYATIDFSNASDSVVLKVIEKLFPQRVVGDLLKLRSPSVVLPNGHLTELWKLSSMGNGFTFEVMTCLLLSACRVFTDNCSVYGDDVIILNEHAEAYLKLTKQLGFQPNNKKTFVFSNFRESCGKFYHDDYGYLTSFDIKRCVNYSDIVTTHNKLVLILEEHAEHLNESVFNALIEIVRQLSSLGPASRCGPLPTCSRNKLSNLSLYFYKTDSVRIHMRVPALTKRYAHYIDKLGVILADYQLDPKGFVLVNVVKTTPRKSTKKRDAKLVNHVRLLNKRPVRETVRGENTFATSFALCEVETGRVILLKNLLLQQFSNRKDSTRTSKTLGAG